MHEVNDLWFNIVESQRLHRNGDARTPSGRFSFLAGGFECVRIQLKEAWAEDERAVHVERWNLQSLDGFFVLVGVEEDPRFDHRGFGSRLALERFRFVGAQGFERFVYASDGTLTVSDRGDVVVDARNAAVGTQFTECFAVLAGRIRGQSYSFADEGDAATTTRRGFCVREGQFRVNIDQCAGHNEVLRYPWAVLFIEEAEFAERFFIEFVPGYARIDFWGAFAVGAVCGADVAATASLRAVALIMLAVVTLPIVTAVITAAVWTPAITTAVIALRAAVSAALVAAATFGALPFTVAPVLTVVAFVTLPFPTTWAIVAATIATVPPFIAATTLAALPVVTTTFSTW